MNTETTEVCINYDSNYTNNISITWKSNVQSGYNRYAMRIFGYID